MGFPTRRYLTRGWKSQSGAQMIKPVKVQFLRVCNAELVKHEQISKEQPFGFKNAVPPMLERFWE